MENHQHWKYNNPLKMRRSTTTMDWEKYTISYDPNGGKDAPASQQKTQTVPLTLSNVRPTKENTDAGTYAVSLNSNGGGQSINALRAERTTSYSFKSWNTAADGSGTSYAPGASYTADADVTLYAQWDSNTATAPVSLPTLIRDGYLFKGWSENADAETGITGSYRPNGNVTLYAVWRALYTVSYDPNGGKDAPASQQKTQTVPLTLSNVRPTHENSSAGTYSVRLNTNDGGQSITVLRAARTTSYSFKGWNTAADGSGTDYAPGASYTADADVTLYAQWESSTKTAPVTLPELARDDGIFKGWAESRDAESGIVGEYTPTGNVTLYAIWHRADLVLPASLNTVESEAFTGGAFTYVFIPETVTRIDSAAFASCPKLTYAQFAGADTEIDGSAFDGVSGLTIIAPSGSTAEAYASAHGFDFLPAA